MLGWGASRLFDLAAPRPIRFTETDAEPGPPGRLGEPREPDRAPEPATSSSLLSGVLPDVLLDRLQAWRDHPVLDAARRIRSWWDSRSTRSRRLMIATAAVAATVAVAGLAFPAGGPAPEADQVPTETGLSTGEPAAGAGAAPGSSGSAESTVAGDDPLAALSVLLDVRERCYRELSVLCLDAVDQPGSPAYAADRARIDEAQRGAELHLPAQPTGSPSLRERLGDSALVAYGAKEWLMIRGAEGWRIRDMFDVEAPSG